MPKISAVETVQMPGGRPYGWTLVKLVADDGSIGFGDASDSQAPQTAIAAIHELVAPVVLGRDAAKLPVLGELGTFGTEALRLRFEGLPLQTAASAVEMAMWDLASRLQGEPLFKLLGATGDNNKITLYANINRGLTDHSPASMARAAEDAVIQGFDAVKCAPFAGFDRANPSQVDLSMALRRVEAVRNAIGDKVLFVDAHGRLGESEATYVAERLEEYRVGWFEEPARFQDDADTLKAASEATSIPIAAGELLSGPDDYRALISHGATSVVMTDVKHNGGIAATLAIADLCELADKPLSLHNPTGPISTLVSGHVCMSVGQTAPLEYSTDAQRLRESTRLVGEHEALEGGMLVIGDGPGIGVDIRPGAFEEGLVRRSTL